MPASSTKTNRFRASSSLKINAAMHMNLTYYPRLPEDYGEYWFQLKDGSRIWGYYTSFPYPHDRHIRIAALEECRFYYVEHGEIAGYFDNEKTSNH